MKVDHVLPAAVCTASNKQKLFFRPLSFPPATVRATNPQYTYYIDRYLARE